MKRERYKNYSRITIEPGEYYATSEIAVISTLLGSCVAACLYDPHKRLIGMNHFLLSGSPLSKAQLLRTSEGGRYGVHAMELLISDLVAKGAARSDLRAKIFGGATLIGDRGETECLNRIGSENCRFIKEFLRGEGIPVDAEDLGGEFGRVIHFSNGDFSIYRRKVGADRSASLARRDRECWQQSIREQVTARQYH